MNLLLPPPIKEQIEDHATTAYPEECCGIMIGDIPDDFGSLEANVEIFEIRRLDNSWENPYMGKKTRYQMDPHQFMKIEKELSGTGRGVLGIYHSHPDVAAWPSPFDLDHAWPAYAYLILSIKKGSVADSRIWQLVEEGRSFEEGLIIVPAGKVLSK